MRKLIFPFKAKLIEKPAHYQPNMSIGEVYTVLRWAGACFVVSTDIPGVTAIVHNSRFEEIPHEVEV